MLLSQVNYPVNNQGSHWNLHNVWDFGLIVNREGTEGDWFPLRNSILARVKTGTWKTKAAAWRKSTDASDWVQDSLDAATEKAYRFANGTLIRRTHGYSDEVVLGKSIEAYMASGGIVEEQLAKGGVRLAAHLEALFG